MNKNLNEYKAAGGVVYYNGQFLVLQKLKVDELRLPKGHIEPGESAEEAALREVGEEGGYTGLKIVASLGSSITEFDHPKKPEHIRREEFYFLMEPVASAPVERERDEEDRARFGPSWLPPEEALAKLTFDEERLFVQRAIDYLSSLNPEKTDG
jgi:8-oxo-dGTP pyrophosphatase MutT (NUDIX family)